MDRVNNPIVYLTIQIGKEIIGRIVVELRADLAPASAENFRLLCVGTDESLGPVRSYKQSIIHRATKDVNCQGGDYERGDGTGGRSAYQNTTFEDDSFILRHTGPGIFSNVNSGPDSNKSGFYLSFAATEWLDNRNVVFGYAVGNESLEVVRRIHDISTASGEPLEQIKICDCGQIYP